MPREFHRREANSDPCMQSTCRRQKWSLCKTTEFARTRSEWPWVHFFEDSRFQQRRFPPLRCPETKNRPPEKPPAPRSTLPQTVHGCGCSGPPGSNCRNPACSIGKHAGNHQQAHADENDHRHHLDACKPILRFGIGRTDNRFKVMTNAKNPIAQTDGLECGNQNLTMRAPATSSAANVTDQLNQ